MYGGTKTEMQRLIKTAAKTDKSIKANDLSYANMVKAIHEVQKNMGIMGTTQKEAESTITGSLNMVKSAWGNLMPALIQGGDSFDQCINNLVYSVGKFAGNVKPAILKAISGAGKLIETLVPKIAEEIPTLVNELLPPLIKAGLSVVQGLIKSLPSIVSALVKEIPNIIRTLMKTIVDTFGEQFPILKKITSFFSENAEKIGNSIKKIIPVVVGLAVAFKGFKGIQKITSIFGKLKGGSGGSKGGIFDGITNTFKSLAKTKVSVILKGMANLAIIVAGMTAMTALIMLISPYLADLTDLKSFVKVVGAIGVLGVVGTALAKLSSIVGKIPVGTVVKGLVNIGIILGGMTALLFVVNKVFEKGINFMQLLKVVAMIGILGTVGSVLAGLAGIVGMIPVPVVLSGLASIALVIGGMTAIITAFGALSKIDGFNDFISSGGDLLANLFKQIGKIGGSLIGGIGEGITNSLPTIGKNLTAFAESIKPMFSMFQGVDMSGIGGFFESFGSFMLKMGANNFLSMFGGEMDLTTLGPKLTIFATGIREFFNQVATFPVEGFTNAKLLFESLADISNIPNVAQFFAGTEGYGTTAVGLIALVQTRPFFEFCASLKEQAFTNAKKFFESLADISNIPNVGGVGQFFSGLNDFQGTADGLNALAKSTPFFDMVSNLPETAFTNTIKLFEALAGIDDAFPNEDGVFQWFTGKNNISGVGESLKKFGEDTSSFFQSVTSLNVTNINSLWASIEKASEIATIDLSGLPEKGTALTSFMGKANGFFLMANTLVGSVGAVTIIAIALKNFFDSVSGIVASSLPNLNKSAETLTEIVSTISSLPQKMVSSGTAMFQSFVNILTTTFTTAQRIVNTGINKIVSATSKLPQRMANAIRSSGHLLASALASVYQNAVKATAGPMNQLINSTNIVLKQLGSVKALTTYQPYANGTDGHKGGNALVNDGRGAELVQMPNGNTFIPKGRNVFIPNAPKGMKVLSAEQTAQFMGRKKPTFNYADGTGSLANAYKGKGYANGGIATKPSIFGEDGAEMAIPLSPDKRQQGLSLWQQTGRMLGLPTYTPESGGSSSQVSNTEYNTYSPQFNLTISGSNEDRKMERKVKKWINEAMNEVLESMARKNPRMREF